ncbi:MAG: carbohydrate kinase family protein [Candidatus Bathyarchaeota archaeon]|nr:MAG: carbohydrate kinase family protein [Candidatus Bathyarchaeum tardum]WNZ30329.1 MAG: carbohydrate kinase family protein [Candidatus Bathyarchaeota archaeon]
MTFDVVGFGALNLDKLFKVNIIAKEEQEGFVTNVTESPGGSAANTTVGTARLDLKTGYVGKVAKDREGQVLLNEFKKEGVDINGITVSKTGRSGTVMGFVDTNGDRALYVDPGVNDRISVNDVNMDYVSDTKFLHLTSFVGEKTFRTQKEVLTQLLDVKISFDPGALYINKGMNGLKPIIQQSSVMFPNSLELKQLTGKDYKEGANVLLDLGVEVVAVKLGKAGCYVTDGNEHYTIEAYKVHAVDTTGAGDAFCAGFLYGLIKEKDLYECGKIGNFVASRCVQKMGARTGLPHLPDLKNF